MSDTLDLAAFARLLASPPISPASSWRPWIVRLALGDFPHLEACCRDGRIAMADTMERQLTDLAFARLPAASAAERRRFIDEIVALHGGPPCYGNWVYLPWEARIVHLLDEDTYLEVITNRNRDKITREEQQRLRTKRIGVMGLSVGGEAAVTVAQEHLCGTIVLADFDRLDLSNLNRLQAGIDDLGECKTTIVARRIAQIDPYLDVTVFDEGVTAANADSFLDGLDLVIEECDNLAMKWEVRRLAKRRGVNLVFAADERGFLSIEPYGDRPDLPVFHGKIQRPQPPRDAFAISLEFLRALTEWMGGWDSISERSRRSLECVGRTLCGYPQLASEARYAAGAIGHVTRRLLLGEGLPPFLGNLDLEGLLAAERPRGP